MKRFLFLLLAYIHTVPAFGASTKENDQTGTVTSACSTVASTIIVMILLAISGAACCFAKPSFGSELCNFASNSTLTPPGACSLTGSVPAGATMVVMAAEDGNDYHVANVTDSRGNTYSQALYYHNTNFQPTEQSIWYAYVTHPLTRRDYVRVKWSASITLYKSFAVNVAYITGVAQSGQPDSVAENNAYMYTTAVTIPGTTVAPNTIVIGFIAANDFVWTIGSGWTIYRSNNVNIYYDFFYQVLSSAGSTDPAGTGPAANTYSGVWAAFKAAAAPSAIPPALH